jgi:hypothetical protein
MNNQHTAGDRTPFTYVIRFPTFDKLYYGVRYAKGCLPDDLGTIYFSSSKTVAKYLKVEPTPIFEVRKTFSSVEASHLAETRFLKRVDARHNPKFLNRHNNDCWKPLDNCGEKNPAFGKPGTMLGRKHSEKTLQQMSDVKKGERNYLFGKHHSKQQKNKFREAQLGEKSHKFKGWYHTPLGRFGSKRLAADAFAGVCVRRWCNHPDRVVSKLAVAKSSWLQQHHIGLTFRELGFWFEPINPSGTCC